METLGRIIDHLVSRLKNPPSARRFLTEISPQPSGTNQKGVQPHPRMTLRERDHGPGLTLQGLQCLI